MSSRDSKIAILITLYLIVGVFTFAFEHQRYNPNTKDADLAELRVKIVSTCAGLCWPIYWVGKLAFYVTKP